MTTNWPTSVSVSVNATPLSIERVCTVESFLQCLVLEEVVMLYPLGDEPSVKFVESEHHLRAAVIFASFDSSTSAQFCSVYFRETAEHLTNRCY